MEIQHLAQDGNTPLHLAIESQNLVVVECLVGAGAPINAHLHNYPVKYHIINFAVVSFFFIDRKRMLIVMGIMMAYIL